MIFYILQYNGKEFLAKFQNFVLFFYNPPGQFLLTGKILLHNNNRRSVLVVYTSRVCIGRNNQIQLFLLTFTVLSVDDPLNEPKSFIDRLLCKRLGCKIDYLSFCKKQKLYFRNFCYQIQLAIKFRTFSYQIVVNSSTIADTTRMNINRMYNNFVFDPSCSKNQTQIGQ